MFTISDLPYAYNALEPFIDEQTMKIHHDKHHAAYVKNLNDALVDQSALGDLSIEALLRQIDSLPDSIRQKIKNNGGGHYNHTQYWEAMQPGGSKEPFGELLLAINQCCGDFNSFKDHFTQKGLGRFGSGWVWLVKESGDSVAIYDSANQDNPIMEGKEPILGLDVWEHAYYLKYQNLRADYIAAWWQIVNWDVVSMRFLGK